MPPAMASATGEEGALNYFTCTLGEAIPLNARSPPPFHTINGLIDYQALQNPHRPAVGFCYDLEYRKEANEWSWVTYSISCP